VRKDPSTLSLTNPRRSVASTNSSVIRRKEKVNQIEQSQVELTAEVEQRFVTVLDELKAVKNSKE